MNRLPEAGAVGTQSFQVLAPRRLEGGVYFHQTGGRSRLFSLYCVKDLVISMAKEAHRACRTDLC